MGLKPNRPYAAIFPGTGNRGFVFGFTIPDPTDTERAQMEHWTDLDETLVGKKVINQIYFDASLKGVRKQQGRLGIRTSPGVRSEIISRRIKAHNERIKQSRLRKEQA